MRLNWAINGGNNFQENFIHMDGGADTNSTNMEVRRRHYPLVGVINQPPLNEDEEQEGWRSSDPRQWPILPSAQEFFDEAGLRAGDLLVSLMHSPGGWMNPGVVSLSTTLLRTRAHTHPQPHTRTDVNMIMLARRVDGPLDDRVALPYEAPSASVSIHAGKGCPGRWGCGRWYARRVGPEVFG